MRKIIGALNMTIDGVCDHMVGLPDEQIYHHYTDLLNQGDTMLYGRTTYHLMEYWRTFLENPSENNSQNDFAVAMDKIQKVVFSRTLKSVDWKTATLAKGDLKNEVLKLKQQSGKDILVGSRSLIIQLLNLGLLDELQLYIHPMVEGQGLRFFENLDGRIIFNLIKSKTHKTGAIILYYQPKATDNQG